MTLSKADLEAIRQIIREEIRGVPNSYDQQVEDFRIVLATGGFSALKSYIKNMYKKS